MAYKLSYTTIPATLNTSFNSLGCVIYDTTVSGTQVIPKAGQTINIGTFSSVNPGNYILNVGLIGYFWLGVASNNSFVQIRVPLSNITYQFEFYANFDGKISIPLNYPILINTTQTFSVNITNYDPSYTCTITPYTNNSPSRFCSLTRIG